MLISVHLSCFRAPVSVAEATLFPGTVQLMNQPPIRRQPLRGSSARCSCGYSSQKDFAVPGEVEPPPLQSTLFIQDDTLYFYILLHICSFFKRFHYSIPLNTVGNDPLTDMPLKISFYIHIHIVDAYKNCT